MKSGFTAIFLSPLLISDSSKGLTGLRKSAAPLLPARSVRQQHMSRRQIRGYLPDKIHRPWLTKRLNSKWMDLFICGY